MICGRCDRFGSVNREELDEHRRECWPANDDYPGLTADEIDDLYSAPTGQEPGLKKIQFGRGFPIDVPVSNP